MGPLAPVTIAPKGGPLGSAVAERKTIADGAVQEFTVSIPAGATKFTARIGNPSDPAADLDLSVLNAAGTLGDLRVPPGNRLERLTGKRAGQHSIRINDQFRICFTWTPGGPTDVEIVDYH